MRAALCSACGLASRKPHSLINDKSPVHPARGFFLAHHSHLEGGKVMSWDDDYLGARASRPHKAWHNFAYLPHFDQPGTVPLLPFRLADAEPADRVAACRISVKLSGRQAANAAGCLQRR